MGKFSPFKHNVKKALPLRTLHLSISWVKIRFIELTGFGFIMGSFVFERDHVNRYINPRYIEKGQKVENDQTQ